MDRSDLEARVIALETDFERYKRLLADLERQVRRLEEQMRFARSTQGSILETGGGE